jgi:hypothetical protein
MTGGFGEAYTLQRELAPIPSDINQSLAGFAGLFLYSQATTRRLGHHAKHPADTCPPLLRERWINGRVLLQRAGKCFGGDVDAPRRQRLGGHG